MMKKMISFVVLLFMVATSTSFAQEKPKSPKETVKGTVGGVNVEIVYCRPSARGRKMLGGKEVYGQVWRTGANEATIFETSGDLDINGQKLPAGKYGLFTIPGEKEWTIIFNSVWDQWGSFKYDATKDVIRIKATPVKSEAFNERMKFEISDHVVTLLWENLKVSFMAK